jgi:hypothetical protein
MTLGEAARPRCLAHHRFGIIWITRDTRSLEIKFNWWFYHYQPPCELVPIEADMKGIEKDILATLKEVTG